MKTRKYLTNWCAEICCSDFIWPLSQDFTFSFFSLGVWGSPRHSATFLVRKLCPGGFNFNWLHDTMGCLEHLEHPDGCHGQMAIKNTAIKFYGNVWLEIKHQTFTFSMKLWFKQNDLMVRSIYHFCQPYHARLPCEKRMVFQWASLWYGPALAVSLPCNCSTSLRKRTKPSATMGI